MLITARSYPTKYAVRSPVLDQEPLRQIFSLSHLRRTLYRCRKLGGRVRGAARNTFVDCAVLVLLVLFFLSFHTGTAFQRRQSENDHARALLVCQSHGSDRVTNTWSIVLHTSTVDCFFRCQALSLLSLFWLFRPSRRFQSASSDAAYTRGNLQIQICRHHPERQHDVHHLPLLQSLYRYGPSRRTGS